AASASTTPMTQRPPSATLFPYTTLFRSFATAQEMRAALEGYLRSSGEDVRSDALSSLMLGAFAEEQATLRRQIQAQIQASAGERSEEHTSELQSLTNLVCRLLLEKKKHA